MLVVHASSVVHVSAGCDLVGSMSGFPMQVRDQARQYMVQLREQVAMELPSAPCPIPYSFLPSPRFISFIVVLPMQVRDQARQYVVQLRERVAEELSRLPFPSEAAAQAALDARNAKWVHAAAQSGRTL